MIAANDRPNVERLGGFLLERLVAAAGAIGEDALKLAGVIGGAIDPSEYLDKFDHMIEAGFPYDGQGDM